MAHSMMTRTGRPLIKVYLPNLSAAVQHFRTFCSYNNPKQSSDPRLVDVDSHHFPELVWPDKNLGPLANKDRRFPMPGSVGLPSVAPHGGAIGVNITPPSVRPVEPLLDTSVLSRAVPSERHLAVLEEYFTNIQEHDAEVNLNLAREPSATDTLEIVVHDCPKLLCQDFQDLFPGKRRLAPVNVITISQKTENDMSGWSEEVEQEREDLLETFIRGATEICQSLHEVGFWADFIDPSSGRPYLGPYTNSTLFETDERYRHFGFDIKDLGCCKVISHHMWGTRAYIGCIFTDAPTHHPVLRSLSSKQ